ncbi:glycosyltransferase family 4 protein [bacterium]|nr:glycosyltransferase family 4 protein [bacterium]
MKNVLYIIHCNALGGAAISLLTLMKNIDRNRYNIFAILPYGSNYELETELEKLNVRYEHARLPWWDKKRKNTLRCQIYEFTQLLRSCFCLIPIFQIYRLIKLWKIQIVHTNSAMVPQGAVAAKCVKIPHIWHIREVFYKQGPFKMKFGWKFTARFIEAFSCRIVNISTIVHYNFINHSGKTVIIENPLELSLFDSQKGCREFRGKIRASKKTIIVAMIVSGIVEWKRIEDFIFMVSKFGGELSKVKFVIVGRWTTPASAYQEYLKKLISDLNMDGRIILVGFQKDVNTIMQSIDILVHPTKNEPFGRIAIEAMAAGKPVVGVKPGGLEDSVIDGFNGFLVDAGNIDALKEKTSVLINDRKKRNTMGANGRKSIKKFAAETHAERIMRLYKEISNQKAA